MNFIDSHTHLFAEEFQTDRMETVNRALNAGVYQMYLPNIDPTTVESMLDLCRSFPDHCFPMIGLHPCSVNANFKEDLRQLKTWLVQDLFYAIGEIGLDFYWDVTYKKEQLLAFEEQIHWGLEKDLPIVIHTRKSVPEGIELVQKSQNGRLRGVFHCFSGTVEEAKKIIDLGFYLGIGGVATFKNGHLEEVIKTAGPEHILLETDAPYLAPVPNRGKRNESSYIPLIAQKISDILERPLSEIAAITTNNSLTLYQKK